MTPFEREAREAFASRRYQAHRPEPPIEVVRPVEVLAFLLSLAAVIVGLALFLATGTYT
jgi:hypothetical protein